MYYPHLLCHCDVGHGGGHGLGVGVGHGGGHGDPNNTPCAHGPGRAYKTNQKSIMTIALNEISN